MASGRKRACEPKVAQVQDMSTFGGGEHLREAGRLGKRTARSRPMLTPALHRPSCCPYRNMSGSSFYATREGRNAVDYWTSAG